MFEAESITPYAYRYLTHFFPCQSPLKGKMSIRIIGLSTLGMHQKLSKNINNKKLLAIDPPIVPNQIGHSVPHLFFPN
jgi:hypothetical protein